MLATLVRRAASTAAAAASRPKVRAFNPETNPFKTKKVWPPDFTRLSPQEQLRFEKRYKRRVQLRAARPRFVKIIKLVQLVTVTAVTVYLVLFLDWGVDHQPFEGLRKRFWETVGTLQNPDTFKPLKDKPGDPSPRLT